MLILLFVADLEGLVVRVHRASSMYKIHSGFCFLASRHVACERRIHSRDASDFETYDSTYDFAKII